MGGLLSDCYITPPKSKPECCKRKTQCVSSLLRGDAIFASRFSKVHMCMNCKQLYIQQVNTYVALTSEYVFLCAITCIAALCVNCQALYVCESDSLLTFVKTHSVLLPIDLLYICFCFAPATFVLLWLTFTLLQPDLPLLCSSST